MSNMNLVLGMCLLKAEIGIGIPRPFSHIVPVAYSNVLRSFTACKQSNHTLRTSIDYTTASFPALVRVIVQMHVGVVPPWASSLTFDSSSST